MLTGTENTDTLIHEFTKLFGQHGVPEYYSGVLQLRDYIQLQLEQVTQKRSLTTKSDVEGFRK